MSTGLTLPEQLPSASPNPSRLSWSCLRASRGRIRPAGGEGLPRSPSRGSWQGCVRPQQSCSVPGPGPGGAAAAAAARGDNAMCRSSRERRKKIPLATYSRLWPQPQASFLITHTLTPRFFYRRQGKIILFNAYTSKWKLQNDRVAGAGTSGVTVSSSTAPGDKSRAQHRGQAAASTSGDGSSAASPGSLCQGSSRLGKTNRKKKKERIKMELCVF